MEWARDADTPGRPLVAQAPEPAASCGRGGVRAAGALELVPAPWSTASVRTFTRTGTRRARVVGAAGQWTQPLCLGCVCRQGLKEAARLQ